MATKLTPKQIKFADGYLETGNATEAAVRVYKAKTRTTAQAIGSENLSKPIIRTYLDEKARDAAAMIYKLPQEAKNEVVRLNASRDILDRAGYLPNRTSISKELQVIKISWVGAEKYGIEDRNELSAAEQE